jgi:hypothetical protein
MRRFAFTTVIAIAFVPVLIAAALFFVAELIGDESL